MFGKLIAKLKADPKKIVFTEGDGSPHSGRPAPVCWPVPG